jgi:hypothetical protein
MTGLRIVLNTVDSKAPASAPKVAMNAPDSVAAKIATIKHSVSARSLKSVSGGGVSGRCRVTGKVLTMKGVNQNNLQLVDVAGRRALGLSAVLYAGLALPPDSLTPSYTFVTALYLDTADYAGSLTMNFLSGFDAADAYQNMLLRYYGSTNGSNPNILRTATAGSGAAANLSTMSPGWHIVTVDYNNATRLLSLSIDQVATFATATMAAPLAPAAGAYVEIGYHLGAEGLKNSKVGDLYTFSASMRSTELGQNQLAELVAAMKTYYAIA